VADDPLVARIRAALAGKPVSEQKMFGGVGFMLNGNMVAGTLRNELLVRVGKEGNDDALKRRAARPMLHGGRPVAGYITVGAGGTRSDRDLAGWIATAVAHVETLPAKAAKQPKAGARTRKQPGAKR
jgi:TfoX/Sxy family transcriptional regulator of competence genes